MSEVVFRTVGWHGSRTVHGEAHNNGAWRLFCHRSRGRWGGPGYVEMVPRATPVTCRDCLREMRRLVEPVTLTWLGEECWQLVVRQTVTAAAGKGET